MKIGVYLSALVSYAREGRYTDGQTNQILKHFKLGSKLSTIQI